MKAGNISPAAEQAQLVPGVKMQGNVDSYAQSKAGSLGSFQMYLAANAGKGHEIGFAPAASGKDQVKVSGENVKKDFSNLQENTVKDKISGDAGKTENTVGTVNKDGGEAVSEAVNKIEEAVKKELGLSDEEFEALLAELGFCVADLAVPGNVALLVAKVNDTDVASEVADSELTEQLTDLMTAIDTAVAEVADQFDFEPEQFGQMLEEAAKQDASDNDEAPMMPADAEEVQTKQPEFAVVKDESTGKEIKVTIENGKVTDSETTVQNVKTPENAQDAADGQHDKRQGGSEQRGENSFASDLVQNLTQAVAERTEGVSSFTESYTVNAADIIHQVIEAIKVNVSQATSSMELQLNPEHLGKISLNVVTRNGAVTATITAQNEAVKGVIESQIVQLRESLNNQGLKVQSVEVAVANHGFNLGENNAGQEQNNNNRGTRGRRNFGDYDELSEEDDDMADILQQRIMEADGNSVNYTA